MKEVLLSIEDKKYDAFLNFVKTLDYVKVSEDLNLEELGKSSVEVKAEIGGLPKKAVKKFLNNL